MNKKRFDALNQVITMRYMSAFTVKTIINWLLFSGQFELEYE